MKCPKCKSRDDVQVVKDAATYLTKKGKLMEIPGYWCERCCLNWFTKELFKERKHGS